MKSLFTYSKFAALAAFLLAGVLTGCKPDLVAPNVPRDFASLRVLNYTSSDVAAENCTVPLDIYFDPVSQSADTQAKVDNLQFGQASVYTNSLSADANGTIYHLVVRPVRSKDKTLLTEDVTLKAGHRYSYVVYTDPNNTSSFAGRLVEDGAPTPAGDPKQVTFVRFMNVFPGKKLTATVNSINGDYIAPSSGLDYRDVAPYVALNTALDSSYAFYVFDADDPTRTVIGKIAYQSFAPGSYHTIVYAGDLCRTAPHNTMGNPTDSLRVRVLDDNGLGNEETSPIPSSIRYFIINAMIPDQPNHDDGVNQWWAFTVANDANPNHHGFTFDPVQTWHPVPGYGAVNDGIQDVYFSSATLSTWLQVKGLTVANANGDNPVVAFDVHAQRSNMVSDNAYSIIFFDTIPGKKNDSSAMGKAMTSALVTDQPTPGKVTLIFVNAVAPSKAHKSGTQDNAVSFFVNGDKVSFGGTSGKSITEAYDPITLNITAKLGPATSIIDAGSATINNAPPNSIYEVVIMGQRSDDAFHSEYPSTVKIFRINP
jgi:hypothetical protein